VVDYWQTLSAVYFPNLPKYSCFDFVIRHFLAIITALGDVAQLGERGVRNAVSLPRQVLQTNHLIFRSLAAGRLWGDSANESVAFSIISRLRW
jgi:hypothetical protein